MPRKASTPESSIARQDKAKVEALAVPERALSIEDIKSVSSIFIKSGFFQDVRDEAQAFVKIMAGQELGFGAFASMNNVYIIKGKVSYAAVLIAANIKKSGRYDFRVVTHTNTACALSFFERMNGKWEHVGDSTFTIEDAKKAGLGGQSYNAYPRNMLFARALTNGARWYCANVFSGAIYTPDELGAEVDPETGEVLVVPELPPAIPVAHAKAKAANGQDAKPAPEQGTPEAPTYQPFGAITMVTRMNGGSFTPRDLEMVFAPGVRNKTTLEAFKESEPVAYRECYDTLHKAYIAWKDENA